MNRCKTCKHWSPPRTEDLGEVPGTGTCKAVVLFWEATEWDEEGCGRTMKPEYAGKLAFVQDGSDYMASLHTMPEFGCVQHDPIGG